MHPNGHHLCVCVDMWDSTIQRARGSVGGWAVLFHTILSPNFVTTSRVADYGAQAKVSI